MIASIITLKKFISYLKMKLFFKLSENYKLNSGLRIAEAINYIKNDKKIKSVIFWTTHKCASTFVSKFLLTLARDSNLRYFDYASHIWELGNSIKIKNPYQIEVDCDFLYRKYGEIYGPIRKPFDFSYKDQFNNIFFLRDPRDLIISLYYSLAYSHPLPLHNKGKEKFIKKRYQARKMGIDKFFLEQIDKWIIPYFTKYRFIKENSKLSSVHKYEDLKKNPRKFILEITKKMNVSISKKLLNYLVNDFEKPFKNKADLKKLKKFSHTRSGKIKQFQHELKKDTLREGNRKLKKILNYWNFEI